jgi:hypothetical protein
MKVDTCLRGAWILLLLLFSQATRESLLVGMAIVYPFALFHFAAAGFLSRHGALVIAGPYRFMRHPLTTAAFLMDIGLGVAASGLAITFPLALLLIHLLVTYGRAVAGSLREEERELRASFGETYDRYCRQVPRFLPNPFSTLGIRGHFSYDNLLDNGELHWFVGRAVLPFVIYLARLFSAAGWSGEQLVQSGEARLILWVSMSGIALSLVLAILCRRRDSPREAEAA